jgi:antitoxin HigA-1
LTLTTLSTNQANKANPTNLRLARYFGTTPDFWLNLQTAYDLKIVQREIGRAVENEVRERKKAAWACKPALLH